MINKPGRDNNIKHNISILSNLIDSSTKAAYFNINNNLLSDTKYFLDHMEIIKKSKKYFKYFI
ncbi:MAG: hypothetical protein ACLTDP_10805 [Terrisporobacter sp.]